MCENEDIYINYETDPLDLIGRHEVYRLNDLLYRIEDAGKLCESAGEEIIAEFGFRGGLEAVQKQILALLDRYALEGVKDSERLRLAENEKKRIKWYDDKRTQADYYKKKLKEYHFNGNWAGISEIAGKQADRRKELHDKKECICFNN